MCLEDTKKLKSPEPMPWLENGDSKNKGVLYITKKGLGNENEHGKNLLLKFLKAHISIKIRPEYIIFTGNSIQLLNEVDEMDKILLTLEEYNSKIVFCDQSIDEYNIILPNNVGKVMSMESILDLLYLAERVITI